MVSTKHDTFFRVTRQKRIIISLLSKRQNVFGRKVGKYLEILFQVAFFSDKYVDKCDYMCYYMLEIKFELQFSRIGAYMEIKRDFYLNQLIARKHNGLIKVITGVRRCGKSYLLNSIFYRHLLRDVVDP